MIEQQQQQDFTAYRLRQTNKKIQVKVQGAKTEVMGTCGRVFKDLNSDRSKVVQQLTSFNYEIIFQTK